MDQAARLRELARARDLAVDEAQDGARILAVTSGKGGVGKTTISVNLALCLAAQGIRTAVVDADLGLSGVDVLMGLTPRYHLGHVLEGSRSLSEVALESPEGVLVVAGGPGWRELADASNTDLSRLVGGLRTLPGQPQVIVLDTSPGISRNVSAFAAMAHLALVVTTPDPTSLADAYACIKVLSQDRPDRPLRLLPNQVLSRQECERLTERLGSVTDRFLGLRVPALGFVPQDSAVGRALQLRKPLVRIFPQSPAALSLRSLSRLVARELLDPVMSQAAPQGGG